MSATVSTRRPRNLLLASSASSAVVTLSRPCASPTEMLGAIGDPFHRTLELLRRDRRQRIFAIRKQLGAEAAAGVRIDDPHFLRRDVEDHLAQNVADAVRPLAAERQREAVLGLVVFGDDRAGVEIIGDEALIDDGERHSLGRRREGRVGLVLVADRLSRTPDCRACPATPAARRACSAATASITAGMRLPVDRDRFGGVARLLDRVGNDEGDGIADVVHFLAGQNFVGRRREVDAGNRKHHRQLAEVGGVLRRS